MKIKESIVSMWRDESAQGATEYILLLVVVVTIAMIFRDKISKIISGKVDQVGGAIDTFNVNP